MGIVNTTATFTVDGVSGSIVIGAENNINGLHFVITDGAVKAKITKQDGTEHIGQYVTATITTNDPSYISDVFLLDTPHELTPLTVILTTVGYVDGDTRAAIFSLDNENIAFAEDEETYYRGYVWKVSDIILGEGVLSNHPLGSASLSWEKSVDLAWYPLSFSQSEKDTTVIVGSEAPASHTIVAGEILLGLPSALVKYHNALDVDYDSSVDHNIILIGGPCINTMTHLYFPDELCAVDVPPGKGLVKLIEQNDRLILLINSYGELEIKKIGSILRSYNKEFHGKEGSIMTTPSTEPVTEPTPQTIDKATILEVTEDVAHQLEQQSLMVKNTSVTQPQSLAVQEPLVLSVGDYEDNTLLTSFVVALSAVFVLVILILYIFKKRNDSFSV